MPAAAPTDGLYQHARSRLPPLATSSGLPIKVKGTLGGAMAVSGEDGARLLELRMGFPISVRSLRLPNARGQCSSASSHSIIDFDFVLLSGLSYTVAPLHDGIDKAETSGLYGGGPLNVLGYVDVLFDTLGYESEQRFWVTNIGLPLDMQLGNE